MGKEKEKLNRIRQKFLLTFFDEDVYTEKEVNGFMLVKQFNGNTGNWQVAIYEKDSFRKYKDFTSDRMERKKLFDYHINKDA